MGRRLRRQRHRLAQALGTGRSDAFRAGVYGTRYFGPAYLGAAFAFTNNWFIINRTALGDQLTANFQGQSFGVRVESGYRYAVAPAAGVTPYAAIFSYPELQRERSDRRRVWTDL